MHGETKRQSIQEHSISNLSPLAPALRGLEDARTQRWTFCEPCSMEQNVQAQGEHCQHGMTIKHVWENAEMPKHCASKAMVLKMSLDWEPHAKTAFLRWSVEHSENSWRQFHYQKTYKHNKETVNTTRLHGSMKWAVVGMFAKSGFGTREIRSQVEKREKHEF